MSQIITHRKKLKAVDAEMQRFLEGAAALKGKLATLLVQLPPFLRKDLTPSKSSSLNFHLKPDSRLSSATPRGSVTIFINCSRGISAHWPLLRKKRVKERMCLEK